MFICNHSFPGIRGLHSGPAPVTPPPLEGEVTGDRWMGLQPRPTWRSGQRVENF